MSFEKKLRKLMEDMQLSQAQVCQLTGIGKSSISQYLAGIHEPTKARQSAIAKALGVQPDYFDEFMADATLQQNDCFNLPVTVAAKLMQKSPKWIEMGLQEGRFPFGYAVKMGRWSYYISSVKFSEYTGIPIPVSEEGAA